MELERLAKKLDTKYSKRGPGQRRRWYYLQRQAVDADTVSITILKASQEGIPTEEVLSQPVTCSPDVAYAVVYYTFERSDHCVSQPSTPDEEAPANNEQVHDDEIAEILNQLIAAASIH